jgi:excisionase family DNA binding protein
VWRVREVAERLGVTIETVLKRLHEGSLKGFRVGRAWRIRDSELTDFMQRPPEPRARDESHEEPSQGQEFAAVDAELDPGLCDRLPLLGRIEALVQQASPPRPIEA